MVLLTKLARTSPCLFAILYSRQINYYISRTRT